MSYLALFIIFFSFVGLYVNADHGELRRILKRETLTHAQLAEKYSAKIFPIIFDTTINADQKLEKLSKLPADVQDALKVIKVNKENLGKLDKVFNSLKTELLPKATKNAREMFQKSVLDDMKVMPPTMVIDLRVSHFKVGELSIRLREGSITGEDVTSYTYLVENFRKKMDAEGFICKNNNDFFP